MKRSTLFKLVAALAVGFFVSSARAADSLDDNVTRSKNDLPLAIGHIGINLGSSRLHASCHAGFECKNPTLAGKIYTGAMVSPGIGLELGYVNTGNAKRNGGTLQAQGLSLSLVGELPISHKVHATLKLGGIYGWTNTSASPQSPASREVGKKQGLAPTYGAGLGFDIDRHHQLRVEWDRQFFCYASGKRRADFYSFGWRYTF